MKFKLTAILFLIFCNHSYSQNMGFRKGAIVTQTNDTIFCLVPITASFGQKIIIKKNNDSQEEVMKLKNIKYLVTSTNIYENVSFKKNEKEMRKLMWLAIEGEMNLYLEVAAKMKQSYQNENMKASYSPPYNTYVIKKDSITYLVEEKNFSQIMKSLVSANPDLVSKIESGLYKYDNLEGLVKEYNRLKGN